MREPRLIELREHDDGRDAWSMARIAPPPALAGLVAGLVAAYSDYRERTSFSTRRELPSADGVLIVNLADPLTVTGADGRALTLHRGEAFVAGAHLGAALSRSTGEQAGIHVHLPLAALRRMTGVPMTELTDRVVALDTLLGAAGRDLGERLGAARSRVERTALLDAMLVERMAASRSLCPRTARAVELLARRPDRDVMAVAAAVGWSRKHLVQRVKDMVGVGPRSYRRLLRFARLTTALRGIERPDWAGLAHDLGYCDQPHLNREFREFTGLTPSVFLARSLPDGGGLIEA